MAMLITLFSCQTEETEAIVNDAETASLFLQLPDSSLDNRKEGFYQGVFNTFDTTIKGQILINLGNQGQYKAEVQLLSGETLYFNANTKGTNNLVFSNHRGSFTINISDDGKAVAEDLMIDEKQGYIRSYKKNRGSNISLALGTYEETGNTSFTGNWDMVNLGSQVSVAGIYNGMAPGIDNVVISSPNGSVFEDTNFTNEPITVCTSYTAARAYVTFDLIGNGFIQLIEAQDQVSTFGGVDCSWGLSASAVSNINITGYTNNTCQTVNSGIWSWNGKTGTISVSSIGLPTTGPSNL